MSSTSILAYIIMTLSIGYAFTYPFVSDISTLFDEKQKNEETLVSVINIETKKNELLTKYNQISIADKDRINTILPSSFNFIRLIFQIDTVASKYGISISNISSAENDQSVGATIDQAEPPRDYKSADISFSYVSSYEVSNLFLDDLEKSLRILDIKSVKLAPQGEGLYLYNIEFETYWYN